MGKIALNIDGRTFLASMLEDKAPRTCSSILHSLPLRGKVIHARWSGEAIWLPLDALHIEVGHENQTSAPSRGELLFYPGFVSEKEILIPYGVSRFASNAGTLAGNHFATISDGLDDLADVGRRVLWEGARDITIDVA